MMKVLLVTDESADKYFDYECSAGLILMAHLQLLIHGLIVSPESFLAPTINTLDLSVNDSTD